MTAPKDLPYTIAGRELVAESDGMRVQILTLAKGEEVPRHYHSTVSDIFVCLEGTVVVETRAPRSRHELSPGQHCVVPAMTAHLVTGKDGEGCRFTVVQGVGEHDFVPVGGVAAQEDREVRPRQPR
jgi:quercetin dioxygenase-like cupin family protein